MSANKLIRRKFLKDNWYIIFCSIIFIAGIIFRSYDFLNRIDYGSDTARDILIAQEALKVHRLPLFASFSSTGPYVFGPHYYWLNMISYFIFPSPIAPFLLLLFFGTISIGVLMHTARIIGGEKLSIITGLLIAFSPQFIARSVFLSQHGYMGFASIFSFLFFILLIESRKIKYSFILGLVVGLATMFHYAGINLLFYFPFMLFIPNATLRKKVLFIILFFFGFFLMWAPLLYWDSTQAFANLRNFSDYILIGQYRIYVPNSWKIFLLSFLPSYWQNVAGGNIPIASFLMVLSLCTTMYFAAKKRLNKYLMLTGCTFLALLLMNRYYRGERFDGYVIFLAPFIFIFSAWSILKITEIPIRIKIKSFNIGLSKLLGYGILCIVLIGSFMNARQFIFVRNYHVEGIKKAENLLIHKYPNTSFAIYDYLYRTTDQSVALAVFLDRDNLSNPKGKPIGIIDDSLICWDPKVIIGKINSSNLVDLSVNSFAINERDWKRKNQEDVFEDSIGWADHEKLHSSFSFINFAKSKLFRH